jgi:hypothetical protein
MQTPTHLLVHTVDVKRPNNYLDASRSPKKIYVTHLEDVACRIVPTSSLLDVRADQDAEVKTHDMYAAAIDITTNDLVEYSNQVYKVVSTINPDELNVFMRIGLFKVIS